MMNRINKGFRILGILALVLVLTGLRSLADNKDYPDRPNPPVLVNDFAQVLSSDQVNQLENKLEDFARNTSNQITVVTMKNLGGHEVAEYSVEVFNRWGLGQSDKNNGVLLLVSMDDHKAWITVGKGLQGVLTDEQSGIIFRNELRPAFKAGDYYKGLNDATDAIIAVTKGEYKADASGKNDHNVSLTAIIVFVIFIIIIIRIFRGGGRGGGHYYSSGGWGSFLTGMFVGNILGGWGGGDNDSGGWGGGDGGGFDGFGGGSTDGGGAGGSW